MEDSKTGTYFHIENGGVSIDFFNTKVDTRIGEFDIPTVKVSARHFGIKTNEMEIPTDYKSLVDLKNNLDKFIDSIEEIKEKLPFSIIVASI